MERLFKLLSDIQANLFVLFHKTWVFHWNVIGPDFQQLHTLFGEQYEAMFEEIDRLSEHMRFLNVRPVGTLSRILEVTSIAEGSGVIQEDEMGQKQTIPGKPIYKSEEMIKRLMTDNMILLELLTEASEEAGNQRSYATENLLQDLMESHGKFVWMLRSCVGKNTKDSVDDSEVPIQTPMDQQMQMAQIPQAQQSVSPIQQVQPFVQ